MTETLTKAQGWRMRVGRTPDDILRANRRAGRMPTRKQIAALFWSCRAYGTNLNANISRNVPRQRAIAS